MADWLEDITKHPNWEKEYSNGPADEGCKDLAGAGEKINKALESASETTLLLHCGRLTHLPLDALRATHVQVLNLGSNFIRRLPDEIGRLVCLKELYLYENCLSILPHSIGQLTNLEELWLGAPGDVRFEQHHNVISTLPASFANLQKLEVLRMSHNKFSSFPRVLYELANLAMVTLDHNDLTALPEDIWRMQRLKKLSLAYNKVARVPNRFGYLKKLAIASFYGNPIYVLPLSVGFLSRLQMLDIGATYLYGLDEKERELLTDNTHPSLKDAVLKHWRALDALVLSFAFAIADVAAFAEMTLVPHGGGSPGLASGGVDVAALPIAASLAAMASGEPPAKRQKLS